MTFIFFLNLAKTREIKGNKINKFFGSEKKNHQQR